MDVYRKLALFKNLLRTNAILTQKAFYTNQFPNFEDYPYTNALYRKNYLKFNKLSILKVDHDYVYSEHERLPNLEERLKEFIDPNDKRSTVNIGFSPNIVREEQIKIKETYKSNRNDKNLEKLARTEKLTLPLDEVNNAYRKSIQIKELKTIAEHYNIYKDLYDCGYFYPIVNFNIKHEYKSNDGKIETSRIYYGNKLDAKYVKQKPNLDLSELDPKKYYTLKFLNLDGNLKNNNNEVLLWLVTNINKEKSANGTEVFDYLPPFPMKGTGWHRCAYILYEHTEPVDYSDYLKPQKADLDSRTFKTLDFYLKYQNKITPVSFLFFQTQWDPSVRHTFHQNLNMKEPVYEYDFGKKFLPAKEKYPTNQVFNWYIEDYKDIKDINEEVLKDYMGKLTPFEDYPQPLKYPGIESLKNRMKHPRWYRYELNDYKYRQQKWNLVPFKYSSLTLNESKYLKSLPYQIQDTLVAEKTVEIKETESVVKSKKPKSKSKQPEAKN